jgi:hypothetical protein
MARIERRRRAAREDVVHARFDGDFSFRVRENREAVRPKASELWSYVIHASV